MSAIDTVFGVTKDGETIHKITMKNKNNIEISVLNFGASIQAISVPDRDGDYVDICLGYNKIEDYENGNEYIGASIGRYANRISNAKFILSGREYALKANEGTNQLHGGDGFNKRIFGYTIGEDGEVIFDTVSEAGENGFPGELSVKIKMSLNDENEFSIEYMAETTEDTAVNMTNHCYFNLNGEGNGDVLSQYMMINSSKILEIDSDCIPTGRSIPVNGTPFDFTHMTVIGERISERDPQLEAGSGYDHNYILEGSDGLKKCACAMSSDTGIMLTLYTDMPGVQFYSGNHLSGTEGKSGIYSERTGFCLETQFFPDSPNRPEFPSALLRRGEVYRHKTVYCFDVL